MSKFIFLLMSFVLALSIAETAVSETVTWIGGDNLWTSSDSDSWSPQYDESDFALFSGNFQGVVTVDAAGV